MGRLTRHVILPLLAPLAIVALYFTPVALLGCANRGYAAFGVAIVGLLVGLVFAIGALQRSRRKDPDWAWWGITAAILALPAALLLGPLG